MQSAQPLGRGSVKKSWIQKIGSGKPENGGRHLAEPLWRRCRQSPWRAKRTSWLSAVLARRPPSTAMEHTACLLYDSVEWVARKRCARIAVKKHWKSLSVLGAIGATMWSVMFLSTGVSSEGLPSDAGTIQVSEGYSWFHDRVRFLIVREWPSSWSVEQRANEPHVRRTAFGGREVLIPSVGWQSVKGGGSVYVFRKSRLADNDCRHEYAQ